MAGYTPIRVNENGVVKTITQYATSYFKDNAVRFINESEAPGCRPPGSCRCRRRRRMRPFTAEPLYANAAVPPFDEPPNYFEADKRDKPVPVENQNGDPESIESGADRSSCAR